jgi:outer membrane protein assembly factor BamD (BamD/ComL family)
VQGELNRGKAALQPKKFDEAARHFDKVARTRHPIGSGA